ncbi:hypothetical protein J437_LFUL012226 [Ladona fulva]|uniref:DDE-1 domain-containing protein n=1 Tax=Ladona fulva TaxID=123851 RepID=A0A8K0KFY4_LADFU|nr:hypothetical protein J437_LFUL012226 [Ladona fulva]
MGFLKASKQFNVPKKRRTGIISKDNGEQDFWSMKDLRSFAYELAEKNGLTHRFNKETCLAGQNWIKGFLTRYPSLSIRTPENTSGARAMGFNKVSKIQVAHELWDSIRSRFRSLTLLFNYVIDKHKLTADKIFNCDETGVSRKRQVRAITSAERGETVTAEVCMSASGLYMPPMLIFPRMKKKQVFELGLLPGGWCEVHPSGWMITDLFLVWFSKFIEFSKVTKESPVLLIVDGHSTHTKNLKLLGMARENGALQPLDVTFFKPLSLCYGEEVRKWLRSHPGKVVTLF